MKHTSISSEIQQIQCIDYRFWQQVILSPERRALEFGSSYWSYSDLATLVNKFSAILQQKGIRQSDIVVIDSDRSPALVIAILAVASIGAVFHVVGEQIPVNFLYRTLQPVNHLHLVSAKSAQTMTEWDWRHLLGVKLGSFTLMDITGLSSEYNATEPQVSAPQHLADPCALLYLNATSGSSGTPKLVKGSHMPVSYFVDWYKQTFDLNQDDRFSLLSGLGYDPMLRDIFTPLSIGGTLCIPPDAAVRSKDGIVKWLAEMAITVMHVTPALARIMFRPEQTVLLPALRFAALGGEPLPVALANTISTTAPHCRVLNFYGTTETPQVVCYHAVTADDLNNAEPDDILPLGKPVTGTILTVEDADGQLVGTGQSGEICIQSAHLFQGYLTADEGSDALVPHTKYRTGDIGRLDAAGILRFSGRRDRQIKYRGHRINLEMIEAMINQFSHIQHCAVLFEPETLERQGLTCYFEAKPDCQADPIALTKQATEALPLYMRPLKYICLTQMPLTSSGKVNRQSLTLFSSASGTGESVTASRTTLKSVQQIWGQLLELPVDKLSVTDNFFDLGGNSLLAARLVEELRQGFSCNIEVTDLFMHPNIKALASYLTQAAEPVVSESAVLADATRLQQRQQHIAAARNKRRQRVS